MTGDKRFDFFQFMRPEFQVTGKPHRHQPVFCMPIAGFDVNMGRLLPFIGVEEKSIGSDNKERGHTLLNNAAFTLRNELRKVGDARAKDTVFYLFSNGRKCLRGVQLAALQQAVGRA